MFREIDPVADIEPSEEAIRCTVYDPAFLQILKDKLMLYASANDIYAVNIQEKFVMNNIPEEKSGRLSLTEEGALSLVSPQNGEVSIVEK